MSGGLLLIGIAGAAGLTSVMALMGAGIGAMALAYAAGGMVTMTVTAALVAQDTQLR